MSAAPTDAQVLAALEVLGWPDDREGSAHIEPDGHEVTPARHYWDLVTSVLDAAAAAAYVPSLLPDGMTEAELIERFRQAMDQPQRITVLPPSATEQPIVVEHGISMSGGGHHIRRDHPEIERIFPLADWIRANQMGGGKVDTRRVIVVDDWTEVPRSAPPVPEGDALGVTDEHRNDPAKQMSDLLDDWPAKLGFEVTDRD